MRNIGWILLVASAFGGAACASTTQTIVAAFYPASLATDNGEPVPANEQKYAYVMGDLDGSGSQQIIAAYWNGVRCAVRVMSPSSGGTLLATAEPVEMGCRDAEVRLVDMDGSHRPLIVVITGAQRGLPGTWIFRWTGSGLAPVGPLRNAATRLYSSDLGDTTFLDLDGSGTLSIIDRHTGRSTDEDGTEHVYEQNRIFRYSNGDFQPGEVADYVEGFLRATGKPAEQKSSFEIADPTKPRQLIIVNGEPGGVNRVSSAVITLNGQPIVGPSSFNQKTAVIKLAVTLQPKNDIGVTLAGKPGGAITILVVPK